MEKDQNQQIVKDQMLFWLTREKQILTQIKSDFFGFKNDMRYFKNFISKSVLICVIRVKKILTIT